MSKIGLSLLFAGLAMLALDGAPAAAARVLIASDSTAASYGADQFPQMGWGMFLPCALPPSTPVVNLARGGRSTKTFIEEGLWASLVASLTAGDTVLIQFGHNDEDLAKPVRHTEADGDYAQNLARFVTDVKAKGAQPVLMTPVARAAFSGGHIAETHGAYAAAVRTLATRTGTPLIDLDARFMAFLDRKGEQGAARYFMIYTPADHVARFPEGHRDTTHLNELGARAAAAIVAHDLARLGLPVSSEVRAANPDAVVASGSAACR